MGLDWRNKPTWLQQWPTEIDKVLFVDESGTSEIPHREKALRQWRNSPQWFALAGVMIDKTAYFEVLKPLMIELKKTFWPPDGTFQYKGTQRRVVLHSHDIRRKNGPFSGETITDITRLYEVINEVVQQVPFSALVSVTDLRKLEGSLPTQILPFKHHPYSLGMQFVLERYAQYLRTRRELGVVVLEARGLNEDLAVLNNMIQLLDEHSQRFRRIRGIYWVSKWAKWDEKKTSYGALEIADLIAYPVAKFVEYKRKNPAFELIEPKLLGYPNYWNRGLKVFEN